jgi:hypothetical protein
MTQAGVDGALFGSKSVTSRRLLVQFIDTTWSHQASLSIAHSPSLTASDWLRVPQVAGLPPASFAPHLAMTLLPSANGWCDQPRYRSFNRQPEPMAVHTIKLATWKSPILLCILDFLIDPKHDVDPI